MFEDMIFFGFLFIISYTLYATVLNKDLGIVTSILNVLGFVGVIIHELSHYTMCVICRVPVDEISIKYRGRGGAAVPHGHVQLHDAFHISFLQSLCISLAPLFVGGWIILILLEIIFISSNSLILLICVLTIISIIIGAAPSQADLSHIATNFKKNIRQSLLQLLMLTIAFLLVYAIFTFVYSLIVFPFVYYIFVAVFYLAIKSSFVLFSHTISTLSNEKGTKIIPKPSKYTRRQLPFFKGERDDGQW